MGGTEIHKQVIDKENSMLIVAVSWLQLMARNRRFGSISVSQ